MEELYKALLPFAEAYNRFMTYDEKPETDAPLFMMIVFENYYVTKR